MGMLEDLRWDVIVLNRENVGKERRKSLTEKINKKVELDFLR